MGAAADGLYDHQASLEVLDDLAFALKLDAGPAHFAAGLGLLAWLIPRALKSDGVKELLESSRPGAWLHDLPADARAPLRNLIEDPAAFAARPSRSEELRAILGANEDGPREDALFKIEGAREVINDLAEECCSLLDQGASDWPEVGILVGELALLGPLLELRALGVTCERDRVQHWRESFESAVRAPQKRHGASDAYLEHVQQAFALLES